MDVVQCMAMTLIQTLSFMLALYVCKSFVIDFSFQSYAFFQFRSLPTIATCIYFWSCSRAWMAFLNWVLLQHWQTIFFYHSAHERKGVVRFTLRKYLHLGGIVFMWFHKKNRWIGTKYCRVSITKQYDKTISAVVIKLTECPLDNQKQTITSQNNFCMNRKKCIQTCICGWSWEKNATALHAMQNAHATALTILITSISKWKWHEKQTAKVRSIFT